MLTRKAKYGLKAMLVLARRHGEGPVAGLDLAQSEAIPKKFLELILLELKRRGLVQARRGQGGGYTLGRAPESIHLGEIIRVLDGPLAPTPCVSLTAYARCDDCPDEATCGVRKAMEVVRDATAEILERTSLADLVRGRVYGEHFVGEQPRRRTAALGAATNKIPAPVRERSHAGPGKARQKTARARR